MGRTRTRCRSLRAFAGGFVRVCHVEGATFSARGAFCWDRRHGGTWRASAPILLFFAGSFAFVSSFGFALHCHPPSVRPYDQSSQAPAGFGWVAFSNMV